MGLSEFEKRLRRHEGAFFKDVLRSKNKLLRNTALNIDEYGLGVDPTAAFIHVQEMRAIFQKRYKVITKPFAQAHLRDLKKLEGTKQALKTKALVIDDVTMAEDLFTEWAREYFRIVGIPALKNVTDTTVNDINNFIESSIGSGMARNEIVKAIMGLSGLNRSRAATIARTETHGAAINAALKVADYTADELGVEYKKRWIATEDNRVRDIHLHMNSVAPILRGEFFIVGGERMIAPNDRRYASAKNYVNCRCAISHIQTDYLDDDDDYVNPYI